MRTAAAQHRVISVTQLRRLGFDKFATRREVERGRLHRVHRGVYAVGVPQLSLRGRYTAAVIACGAGAALSHRSAAHIWGLRPNAAGRLEVTASRQRTKVPGVQVHRTRMLDPVDCTVLDGIPVTSVARTLLDLAAVLRPSDLIVAIDRAERQGIFDLTAVLEVLSRARGRKGARALRRAIAAYEHSTQKSALERRFKQLLESRPDIPTPIFNALVEGESAAHEVDALWEAERLAVQVDGFEFHRTRRDRERDAASDADLELGGMRVIRFTWDDVNEHGDRTLRRVALAAGWRATQTAA